MSQNYGAYQKILDLYPQIADAKDDFNNITIACNVIKNYIKLDNVVTLIGSVGKGSTARYLNGIFMHANKKVAIYNDIFFDSANECIMINNQNLSNNCPTLQETYNDFSNVVEQYHNSTGQYPSMLLAMQMLSLIYLSKKSLDCVIMIIHQYLYLHRDNLLLHIRPVVLGVTILQNSLNYKYELQSLSVYKGIPTYIMHKDINISNTLPDAKFMVDDPVIDFCAADTSGPGKLDNLKLAKTLGKHFMNNIPNSGISFSDILKGIYYSFKYPYRFDKRSVKNSKQQIIFDTIHNTSQLEAFFEEITLYNDKRYHINPNNITLVCALWEVLETHRLLRYVEECQPHITRVILIEPVAKPYHKEEAATIKDMASKDFHDSKLKIEYYTNTQDAMNSALQSNSDILFIGQPDRLVEGRNFLQGGSSQSNNQQNMNMNSSNNQQNFNQNMNNMNRQNSNQNNMNMNLSNNQRNMNNNSSSNMNKQNFNNMNSSNNQQNFNQNINNMNNSMNQQNFSNMNQRNSPNNMNNSTNQNMFNTMNQQNYSNMNQQNSCGASNCNSCGNCNQ